MADFRFRGMVILLMLVLVLALITTVAKGGWASVPGRFGPFPPCLAPLALIQFGPHALRGTARLLQNPGLAFWWRFISPLLLSVGSYFDSPA